MPALSAGHSRFGRRKAPRGEGRTEVASQDHPRATGEVAGGKESEKGKAAMSKPKKWPTMTPEEQEAWLERRRESRRKWQVKNPEKVREKKRKWNDANKEKNREQSRNYREANPERVIETARKWRSKNKEKVREYSRKRRAANPEKVLEYDRKRRASNPEKFREKWRKYREENLEKARETDRKRFKKSADQVAADQFFLMTGAAEQITNLEPNQYENDANKPD